MDDQLRSFSCAPRFWWVSPSSDPSEHRREPSPPIQLATALIGWVLQGGVLISAAIMLVGLLCFHPTGWLSPGACWPFFPWSQLISDPGSVSSQESLHWPPLADLPLLFCA